MATADRMERDAKNKKNQQGTASGRKPGATFVGQKSTGVVAGKSKASLAARKLQNVEVKHGTIRMGAKGKGKNMYNAKTGRWERVATTKTPTVQGKANKTGRPKSGSGSSTTQSGREWIQYGGTRKPTGREVGPGVLGIKVPQDGKLYRFGPPNSQSVYRWNAKTKKFVYVREHKPKK